MMNLTFPRLMIAITAGTSWKRGDYVMVLGEIQNIPGYCVTVFQGELTSTRLSLLRNPEEEDLRERFECISIPE